MFLQVKDSQKLLMRLLGTENLLDQDLLISYFKTFIMMHIKSVLAESIMEHKLNIFTMDVHLPELSNNMKAKIENLFEDYGVKLVRFFVSNIVRPEDDPNYERFKSLYFRQFADVKDAEIKQKVSIIHQETEAQKTVIDAKAQAEKRNLEGYTYQQERGFDVAEKVASNESVGEFSNLGIGMGMISGVGNTLGSVVGSATSQTIQQSMGSQPVHTAICPKCGNPLSAGAKFCSNCGTAVNEPKTNACAKCGHIWKEGEKFCPECGSGR